MVMLAHKHAELKEAKYVVFVNSSRQYVDCSPAISDLLGYSHREMLTKTIDDISYDMDAVPKLFAVFQATRSQNGDFILQHKNRTPVPIRYKAFVFGDGCNAAIWEPIRDWRFPYMAALLELNPEKQRNYIDEALAATEQSRGGDLRGRDEAAHLLRSMRKKLE
jgi:PAS domain-containing protein